jgi:hypothetical protein
VGLAQPLGDHLGRSLRVEKEIAQDLTDGLVGAAVIGFGAGFIGLEGGQAAALEFSQELIITLATIAISLGHSADVPVEALAFNEHQEATGQEVGGQHGQGTARAGEDVFNVVEL